MKGTITRSLDNTLCSLFDDFRNLCTKENMLKQINKIERVGKRSTRSTELGKLSRMFEVCGIPFEMDLDLDRYREIVKESDAPTTRGARDKMLLALLSHYREYPDPTTYMKRIVDRLEEDPWGEDTLRLRILKQFIKYGNYLIAAGYGGRAQIVKYVKDKIGRKPEVDDILEHVDDDIFGLLEEANPDQKDPKGKYGLLKLADDLGTGKFRVEGATKKGLYLFAIVYGMTYMVGETDLEFIDERTDIEKNLFQDYYTNNLMRFLSSEYCGDAGKQYEQDPSGQGINYKNFAEMIYLYYISKYDLTPEEKIEKSSKMIDEVKEMGKRDPYDPDIETHGSRTAKYRANFRYDENDAEDQYSEVVLSMSESDFRNFICQNYDCNVQRSASVRVGDLQLGTDQNSAFEQYQDLVNEIAELADPIKNADKYHGCLKDPDDNSELVLYIKLSHCNYGLWFADINDEEIVDQIYARHKEIDKDKFRELISLLYRFNDFMKAQISSGVKAPLGAGGKVTKALSIQDSAAMTRTSLLVAFYYYFNLEHRNQDDVLKWVSFEEMFKTFKEEADEYLLKSFYQPLGGKNLFDVLVAYSAYAYLNF